MDKKEEALATPDQGDLAKAPTSENNVVDTYDTTSNVESHENHEVCDVDHTDLPEPTHGVIGFDGYSPIKVTKQVPHYMDADDMGLVGTDPAVLAAYRATMRDEAGFESRYREAYDNGNLVNVLAGDAGGRLSVTEIEDAREQWRYRKAVYDAQMQSAAGDPVKEARALRGFDRANLMALDYARAYAVVGGISVAYCNSQNEAKAGMLDQYLACCRVDRRFPKRLRAAVLQLKKMWNVQAQFNNNTLKGDWGKWSYTDEIDPRSAARLAVCMLDVAGKHPCYLTDSEDLAWFELDDPDGPYVLADDPTGGNILKGALRELGVEANPFGDEKWLMQFRNAFRDEVQALGYEVESIDHPYYEVWYRNKIVDVRTQTARDYTPDDRRIAGKLAIDVTLADDGVTVVHPDEPKARFDVYNFDGHLVERDVEFGPSKFFSDLSGNNPDVEDLNYQVVSASARGGVKRYPFLLGEGGIGKSVLIDVQRAMYGVKRCAAVPFEDLADGPSLLSIQGKAANFSDESAPDAHLSGSKLRDAKTVIMGGEITKDVKYRPARNLGGRTIPMCGATNGVPSIVEKGAFPIKRRILIVPESTKVPETLMYDVEDFMVRPDVVEWVVDQALYGREGRGTFRDYEQNAASKAAFERVSTQMDTMHRVLDEVVCPFLIENDVYSINFETVMGVAQASLDSQKDNGRLKLVDKYRSMDRLLRNYGYEVLWAVENVKPKQSNRRQWDESHRFREAILGLECVDTETVGDVVRITPKYLGNLIEDPANLTNPSVNAVIIRSDIKKEIDENPGLTPRKIREQREAAAKAEADAPRIEADAKAKHLEEVDAVKAYEQFLLPNIEVLKPKGLCRPDGSEFWPPSFDEWVATGMRNSFGGDGVNGKKFITPGAGESLLNACGDPIDTGDDPWYCAGIKTGDKVECVGEFVHLPWTRVLANAPDLLAAIRPDGWTEDMPPEPSDGSDEADSGTGTATAPNEP